MKEPRFIRIVRRSSIDLFPRCQRCRTRLVGQQVRWCSPACRQYGCRWRNDLRRHMKGVAQ